MEYVKYLKLNPPTIVQLNCCAFLHFQLIFSLIQDTSQSKQVYQLMPMDRVMLPLTQSTIDAVHRAYKGFQELN